MFPEIKTFPGQGLLRALWAAPRTLNAHKKGHRHYMPISVSFNTQQGIAPMQLHLGFSPFTFDTVPHQCKTVLILSVDHIISMWGTRGGSHFMLHEHRVEHGIQDAHISAVCFTTCIALAAILHRAIKQWSQPVQEQKGNQGRCPKWQVGKRTPDVDISVYEAFFFCTITDLYELWPSPLLVFNTRHWTIRGEGALDYCFLQEYIVQCDCNQKVKLRRGPEWMVTWKNSLTTLKQNRKKSHCQLEYSNLPFLGSREFQREEKFPAPTFTVFFYCIFCFNFYFFLSI